MEGDELCAKGKGEVIVEDACGGVAWVVWAGLIGRVGLGGLGECG